MAAVERRNTAAGLDHGGPVNAADPASHRAYLEAEARALLDYIGRLPLDHLDRWVLSRRYNEIKQELRALHGQIRLAKDG